MNTICPAITVALGWLPAALAVAALIDALFIIGGALVVRKARLRTPTERKDNG